MNFARKFARKLAKFHSPSIKCILVHLFCTTPTDARDVTHKSIYARAILICQSIFFINI